VACRAILAASFALATTPAGASTGASIQKGPYVVDVSDTSAEVRFELSSPELARIELAAADTADAGRPFVGAAAQQQSIRATGLAPATRYAYQVRVGGAIVGAGHFATAPASGSTAPVTFLAVGDDRSDPTAHAAVVRAMLETRADFVVNTGDLVQDAADPSDWQSFFDVEAPLLRETPIFATVGNHELFDDFAGANFARYFGAPDDAGTSHLYRTVRFGIVRLFLLNAMDRGWASGDERSWLERELARADGEAGLVWRVAVLHHGPWSVGPHGPNTALLDAGIPAMLAAHHVDLLLAGHDHIYDRGAAGQVKYIVTGGGGAPLYDIRRTDVTARKAEATYHYVEVRATPQALRVVARRVDGSVIDRCGFAPGQDWDCDPATRPAVQSPAVVAPAPEGAARATSRCGCSLAETHRDRVPGPLTFGAGIAVLLAAARRRRAHPFRCSAPFRFRSPRLPR
jgi:hypothetical protein